LARWLVGPFVNIPERDGAWVVTRGDGGVVTLIVEADRFRLRTGITLSDPDRKMFGSDEGLERWGFGQRWGRFVGTVKYR